MKHNCMIICSILVVAFATGCKEVAIRDANVYSAELEFVDAASDEQVVRGKAIIAAECKCETTMGILGFTTSECNDLAETVLTVESRMKYHTEFMRYLGGLTDTRPPTDPPEIPEATTLCPNGGKE